MKEKEYRDYDEGNGRAVGMALCAGLLLLGVAVICGLLLLTGCTSMRRVEGGRGERVERVERGEERGERRIDSVTDTRFVYVKGDTVVDWRERVRWREREVHDSVFIERTDTIREPYPVERELTRWERTKMDFGGIATGGLAAAICIAVVWLIKRMKR